MLQEADAAVAEIVANMYKQTKRTLQQAILFLHWRSFAREGSKDRQIQSWHCGQEDVAEKAYKQRGLIVSAALLCAEFARGQKLRKVAWRGWCAVIELHGRIRRVVSSVSYMGLHQNSSFLRCCAFGAWRKFV